MLCVQTKWNVFWHSRAYLRANLWSYVYNRPHRFVFLKNITNLQESPRLKLLPTFLQKSPQLNPLLIAKGLTSCKQPHISAAVDARAGGAVCGSCAGPILSFIDSGKWIRNHRQVFVVHINESLQPLLVGSSFCGVMISAGPVMLLTATLRFLVQWISGFPSVFFSILCPP